MQIWAETGKSNLPICNYSQILYQFLTFTQNLKRSLPISYIIIFFKGLGSDVGGYLHRYCILKIQLDSIHYLGILSYALCHSGFVFN